jgi:hypothetical protein
MRGKPCSRAMQSQQHAIPRIGEVTGEAVQWWVAAIQAEAGNGCSPQGQQGCEASELPHM